MAWELKGKYPGILNDPAVGTEATKLFNDAKKLLDRIVKEHLLTANAVYGFFPANADGDDVILWADDTRQTERVRLHMLRQQWEREGQTNFRSLADYLAPAGTPDYIGAFAVTAGAGAFCARAASGCAAAAALPSSVMNRRRVDEGSCMPCPPTGTQTISFATAGQRYRSCACPRFHRRQKKPLQAIGPKK